MPGDPVELLRQAGERVRMDVDADDIAHRSQRYERRRRAAALAVSVLVPMLLISVGSAVLLVRQRHVPVADAPSPAPSSRPRTPTPTDASPSPSAGAAASPDAALPPPPSPAPAPALPPPPPPSSQEPPQEPSQQGATHRLVLEAEDGRIVFPMRVVRPPGSTWLSGGAHVEAGERPVGAPGNPWDGLIELWLDVPTPDSYTIWGRVRAVDSSSNSFVVRVGEGEPVVWHLPVTGRAGEADWQWVQVTHGREREPVTFELPAGRHPLRIRTQEEGTKLDLVLVTNDPAEVPQGVSAAAP